MPINIDGFGTLFENVSGGGGPVDTLTYANATARLNAVGLLPTDVGRMAIQLDNSSFWILRDDSPVTWDIVTPGADGTSIHPTSLWVDGSTTTELNDQNGTFERPFSIISQAMDFILANIQSAYHVHVAIGTYSDAFSVPTSNRIVIEGPIQGGVVLSGAMDWTVQGGLDECILFFRNCAPVGGLTINDGTSPAVEAVLGFESCRIGTVIVTGTSNLTTAITGISEANLNQISSVISSLVIGPLNLKGSLFVTNTFFTVDCTLITVNSIFAAGSTFNQNIQIANNTVRFSDSNWIQPGPHTITFSGAPGESFFDSASQSAFTNANGTVINGKIIVSSSQPTGWASGGSVTRGVGLQVNVASGMGFIFQGNNSVIFINWSAGSITLPVNLISDIYIDELGTINSTTHPADERNVIVLGTASTSASAILTLGTDYVESLQLAPQLAQYTEDVIGPVHVSGLAATIHSPPSLQLDVDLGTYYLGIARLQAAAHAPITFTYWYRDGVGGWTNIFSQTSINTTLYDDGSGTLAALPAGKYKKALLFLMVNGGATEYYVVYAQQFYNSQTEAESGVLPSGPAALTNAAIRIAGIVVLSGDTQITSLTDERPRLGQLSSGTTSITDHGLLAGLSDDDHPQYQLRTQLGGTPSDVTKSAASPGALLTYSRSDHKHDITTAAASVVGTANTEGVATSLSRSDHGHNHGAQTDGTQHAAVIPSGASGFMTGADKSKLDGVSSGAAAITASAPVNVTKAAAAVGVATDAARADHKHDISTGVVSTVGTANAEGTATSLARSDHVHDHGNQSTGTHHAVATGATAGFMSTTDRVQLDVLDEAISQDYSNTRVNGVVTQEQWKRHSDASLLRQTDYTWVGSLLTTEVRKIFAANGITILSQVTVVYTYSSNQLTSYALTRNV